MTLVPTSVPDRHAQALQWLAAGRTEAAADLLAELLRAEPAAALWNDWAACRRRLGDVAGAEAGFLSALEMDAWNGAALANLGRLWAAQERWKMAAPVLERAVARQGGVTASGELRAAAALARQNEAARNPLADGLRILWIHDQLPEADRSGAEQRITVLLAELRRQHHRVTYFARAGGGQERYLAALAPLCSSIYYCDGPRLRWMSDAPAAARLERVLGGAVFDLAIVSHWHWHVWACSEQYPQILRRLSPRTRIIILSEDHHGLREERLADLTGEWTDRERACNYSARELEAYRRADLVWAVSGADRGHLLQRDPSLRIEVLPPIVQLVPGGPEWQPRAGIVFVGEYLNAANRDGVEWFFAAIWPRVRARLPEAKLHLVGSHLPPDFARHPGVVADGFAPELGPIFERHRLAICPVRFGTGIKTKNLAALGHGLPFVTTTCGAEGMDLRNGETALVADDPSTFAEQVVRLYQDSELWGRLAAAGRAHAASAFSPRRLALRMGDTLDQIMAAPVQPDRPLGPVSPLWVEEQFPEVLTHQPAGERIFLRTRRYLDLAQRELAAGRLEAARHQCGHALNLVRDAADPLLPAIQSLLAQVRPAASAPSAAPLPQPQRPRGPQNAAPGFPARNGARWGGAARFGVGPAGASRIERLSRSGRPGLEPAISVIIPTYNRRATLEKCLAALSAQTLAPDRFEVVVMDDGSSDDTAVFCRELHTRFGFRFASQRQAGAGAARRGAVELARGERLLLINDDTIAAPDLLEMHLQAGVQRDPQRLAVLGDFRYPDSARARALTCTLAVKPILFLQPSLEAGARLNYVGFMTCNLSLPRRAVLAAGNFDTGFAVAEDTEMGARLEERGWGVIYHPEAVALHDHGPFSSADFVARARRYGPANLRLYRKHRRLLGDGTGLLGRLDGAARESMGTWLAEHGPRIAESLRAIAAFDPVNFLPFFSRWVDNHTAAEVVVGQFAQALLPIHWYYVYESLLAAWDQPDPARPGPSSAAAAAPTAAGAMR
ncbi:MAG: glycosyltransferase [Terriglobales bacterium]